jgi:hypothetical protein
MGYIHSDAVIEYAKTKSGDDIAMAYAYAFGMVWAFLSDEQKTYILKHVATQMESN